MLSKKPSTIYILDSSVFIHSTNTLFESKTIITTYLVEEEMKSSKSIINFEHFKLSGMEILSPSKQSISKTKKALEKTNDKLSEADISIIALALDFIQKNKDIIIVTEDYGIQNLSSFLNIPFISILNKPISKKFKWIKKCSNCGRIVNNNTCNFCGSTEIKFIPKH